MDVVGVYSWWSGGTRDDCCFCAIHCVQHAVPKTKVVLRPTRTRRTDTAAAMSVRATPHVYETVWALLVCRTRIPVRYVRTHIYIVV